MTTNPTDSTSSSIPRSSLFNHSFVSVVATGAKFMLAQTPFVTSLNRVSVVCCHSNLGTAGAISAIYKGIIDAVEVDTKPETSASTALKKAKPVPSFRHFFKGVTGHLAKETPRLAFKPAGIAAKPSINAYFEADKSALNAFKAHVVFSGTLSLAEMSINPLDTIRTKLQSGQAIKAGILPNQTLGRYLYSGSLANGGRQFLTWLFFGYSESYANKFTILTTSIDPHSNLGIVIKALPQSALLTLPTWPFERVKNELQTHPKLNTGGLYQTYKRAITHIIETQGVSGMIRGYVPKTLSNAVLVIGADYLLEMGRAQVRASAE